MKHSGIEWIGEIPDDWKVERLQWYIEEVKISNNPMQTDRVLSLTNKAGVIPYEEKGAQGNVAKEDYTQYKLAYPNTIVANSMNILIGSVGICNYFGCVSPVYYVFRPTKKADLLFINYIMQTIPFQKELRRYANGILEIRLRVSANGILKRKIAIPNLEKQKNIVDKISKKCAAVDRMIENQRAQIEKLKEYKQSVITEAVTRGLDPSAPLKDSGIEWLGKIPAKWNVNRLKYRTTYNDEILKDSTPQEEIIRYVEIGSVSLENGVEKIEEYAFKDAPSRARRIAKKDDIIISTVRTYLKAIASIKEELLIVSTGFCVLRPNNQINSKYLEYFCKSNLFTEYVSANSYGISYPAINASSLVAFHIIEPLIEEQQQIADYLDKKCAEIDKLIAIKQQKIETLTEYKKSLIYEYVTGKKQVG